MIPAIETRYAGCRFRSRLEARWAVFFDALGIRWEYEPEGLVCSKRLSDGSDPRAEFPYLPDFWLPDVVGVHGGQGVWVEVKGSLNHDKTVRLCDIAAHLSSGGLGGCRDGDGNDLIALGPIPRPDEFALPVMLHMHKGDLEASPWPGMPNGCEPYRTTLIARDYGNDDIFLNDPEHACGDWEDARHLLLYGQGCRRDPTYHVRQKVLCRFDPHHNFKVAAAYTAARSARFEHGEKGAA